MASLRVRGLKTEDDLKAVTTSLAGSCALKRSNVAAQSANNFEATLTFTNETHSRKAAECLADMKSREPSRMYDGVVIDANFLGLTVLFSSDPIVDVIAVHGLGGHAADTWTFASKDSVVLWLRDILPVRTLTRSRIMSFGYDSSTISRSTASIRDVATQLLNLLGTLRRSDSEKSRPIFFMAHSLGGIVVKFALNLSRNQGIHADIYACTRAIVFFGTPHHGSGTANWGATVASIVKVVKTVNTGYLETLKARSSALADLDDDFVPLLRDGNFTIYSVYETRKTKINVMKSIQVVHKASALLNSTNEVKIPADANHREVCKFESHNDDAYRILSTRLTDLLLRIASENALLRPVIAKQSLMFPKVLPRDRYFYGREKILLFMKEYLDDRKERTSGPRCLALYGEPAVGKTSLVKRFIQNSKNDYDCIFLITAESISKISQEFVGIGRSLNLTKSSGDDPGIVRDQVLDHLSSAGKRCLLIYDNADNLEGLKNLGDFWPYDSDCSILVTSRDANVVWRLPTSTEGLQIKSMTEKEGEEFLMDRLKAEEETRPICRSVAIRFHCWPLALSQVSAWILETKTSLRKFWNMLLKKPETENRIYAFKDEESRYCRTLSEVWDSILETLSPESAKLLSVLSLMDPDGIPNTLFKCWRPDTTRVSDSPIDNEYEYIMAQTPLLNYSIIEVVEDVLSLHRIVQTTRLRGISSEEKDGAFETALGLLAANFPRQIMGNHMHSQWLDCEPILPHVLSFDKALHIHRWKMSEQNASRYVSMMCDVTWYMWELGQYDEVLNRLEHVEKICFSTIGLDTLEAARLFVVRGCVYSTLNRYGEAGILFQKGLEIRKARLAPDDQLLANSYMQVGNYYLNEDRFDDAIEAQTKVIAIRQRSYHLTPEMMAISYLNLSRALLGGRRLDDAEEALQHAARCANDLTPAAKKNTESARLYVLGNVKLARGELNWALQIHQKALELKEECKLPPFTVAASKHKLGDIFAKKGDFTSAKTNLREAIEALETVLGTSTAKLGRIARSEMRLSEVLALNGEAEDAGFVQEKAVQRLRNAAQLSSEAVCTADLDKLVSHLDR